MKTRRVAVLAVIAVSAAWSAPATDAQTRAVSGNAEAGRALALSACTSCHVVAPDQPFKPIYTGTPRPPDFKEVANQPNVTVASLLHHLESLTPIPEDSRMASPDLSTGQLRDVVAFIITLRDKAAAPAQ